MTYTQFYQNPVENNNVYQPHSTNIHQINNIPAVRGRNKWRWGHYNSVSKKKFKEQLKRTVFLLCIKLCDEWHTTDLNKQNNNTYVTYNINIQYATYSVLTA